MLKKKELIREVYNDGRMIVCEVTPKKDPFGTVIRGEYTEVELAKYWFRELGTTASDIYWSHADDTEITRKIAIRGKKAIDNKWVIKIKKGIYEVYRIYYNPKKQETELSLKEVER
ncbi:MAG: phage head closure protein [Facklamia hominis]